MTSPIIPGSLMLSGAWPGGQAGSRTGLGAFSSGPADQPWANLMSPALLSLLGLGGGRQIEPAARGAAPGSNMIEQLLAQIAKARAGYDTAMPWSPMPGQPPQGQTREPYRSTEPTLIGRPYVPTTVATRPTPPRVPTAPAPSTPGGLPQSLIDLFGGGGGGRDGSGGPGGNSGGPSTPGDRNNDRAINSFSDLAAAIKDMLGDPMNGVPGAVPGLSGLAANIAGMVNANIGDDVAPTSVGGAVPENDEDTEQAEFDGRQEAAAAAAAAAEAAAAAAEAADNSGFGADQASMGGTSSASSGEGDGGEGDGGDGGGGDGGGGDGGGGGFARGGAVTRKKLRGPNPSGPDDGRANLDVGEHVSTAREVKAIGGHANFMKLRRMIATRNPGLLALLGIAPGASRGGA